MRLLVNAWRDLHHPLAGGSEVLVDQLANGMSRRGHTVVLRCASPVSEHSYAVIDAGGRFEQYLTWPIDYLRSHRDVDLVVDVANGMTYFTPLVRRKASLCFVHHVHTEHWSQWFSPPVAAFGRNLEQRITPRVYRNKLFVAVSPSTAEALEALGVRGEQIRVVMNGTDVRDDIGRKSSTPLFLALGRLVPHKRYDLLVEMWRRVHPHTGGELVIVGEGPEREKIEQLAVPGVRLLGHIDEERKQQLLGEAWMLLHPSSLEGWGLVVMEAAASETPTLGFKSRGVRDSVVDGVTGILVDSVDEYVDQWIDLTQDNARRERLGSAARARAKAFTWEQCVDRFEEVAVEATEKPERRRSARRPSTRQPLRIQLVRGTGVDLGVVTTLVVIADEWSSLRRFFARWRSVFTPALTEVAIVARPPEIQSSVLMDAALGGFERCRAATWDVTPDGETVTAEINGRSIFVLNAMPTNQSAPYAITDALTGVPGDWSAVVVDELGSCVIADGAKGRAVPVRPSSGDPSDRR